MPVLVLTSRLAWAAATSQCLAFLPGTWDGNRACPALRWLSGLRKVTVRAGQQGLTLAPPSTGRETEAQRVGQWSPAMR